MAQNRKKPLESYEIWLERSVRLHMKPIRLLHLADTADRGGGETYLFLLADRLPRDRYVLSVLCPSEGLLTRADERLDDRGRTKLLGLLDAGDPRHEVRTAWHAKEVVRLLEVQETARSRCRKGIG